MHEYTTIRPYGFFGDAVTFLCWAPLAPEARGDELLTFLTTRQ